MFQVVSAFGPVRVSLPAPPATTSVGPGTDGTLKVSSPPSPNRFRFVTLRRVIAWLTTLAPSGSRVCWRLFPSIVMSSRTAPLVPVKLTVATSETATPEPFPVIVLSDRLAVVNSSTSRPTVLPVIVLPDRLTVSALLPSTCTPVPVFPETVFPVTGWRGSSI